MFFLIFAVLMTIVSETMANSIIQKQEFSGPPESRTLTFDKFNMNGILTSVEIAFNLQIEGGTLILDNDSDNSVSGTFEFGVYGDISSNEVNLPDSSLTNPVFYSQPFSLGSNAGDGTGDYDPTSPDGLQYNGSSESGVESGSINSIFRNDYVGTGTYNIICSVSPWLNPGDIDGIKIEHSSIPVSTTGCIEVSYNYDVIPEPATISLLLPAIFALRNNRNK